MMVTFEEGDEDDTDGDSEEDSEEGGDIFQVGSQESHVWIKLRAADTPTKPMRQK